MSIIKSYQSYSNLVMQKLKIAFIADIFSIQILQRKSGIFFFLFAGYSKWRTQKNWSVKIRKQEARKTKRRINDRVQETIKINRCFEKAEGEFILKNKVKINRRCYLALSTKMFSISTLDMFILICLVTKFYLYINASKLEM